MTTKQKPTLRRLREYTESLSAAYRDRATKAAEREDAESEHIYRTVADVLRNLLEVMG